MRPEKTALVEELQEKVAKAEFLFVADFNGMNTSQTTELKNQLFNAGSRFQVVPNKIFGIAAGEATRAGLGAALEGPTAVIYGSSDVVQTAKILKDFYKANQKPVVKAGAMGGGILSNKDIEALAGMPTREVMLGQFLGTLVAPLSRTVGVLNQKLLSLVYVVKAIQDKKQNAA